MDSTPADEPDRLLSDLQVYLVGGHLEAGMELLADEHEVLATDPKRLACALKLLADPIADRMIGGELGEMPGVLDRLFDLAAAHDARFAAVGTDVLANYKHALLSSRTPPHPLKRVLRHAKLIDLFRSTSTIEGAVAECGCARGLSFMQLCYAHAEHRPTWRGERFFVFDSFEGLSAPTVIDVDFSGMKHAEARRLSSMTRTGWFAFDHAAVAGRIQAEFPDVQLLKGWIPERFAEVANERFRFVHVDVDLYEPTLASFEFFYPRLQPGGILVTDDYNWPGGRRAVDEFCDAHGLTRHLTDTNQAYVIADPDRN